MSTLNWLLENGYPLLLLLFINGMVPYGYGDVRQTPIVRFSHQPGRISLFTVDVALHAVILHTRYSSFLCGTA
jgi:hypothetical protein